MIKEILARRLASATNHVDLSHYKAYRTSLYQPWLQQALEIAKALHGKMKIEKVVIPEERFINFMRMHIDQFADFLMGILLKQLGDESRTATTPYYSQSIIANKMFRA